MKVEKVKIESLTLDPTNVRRHSPRNLDAIKASLLRFGQQKPVVVNADGAVVAGNGTLEAARAMGWREIDIVRTPLKGAEATAYAIADNRTAELAEWNDEALAATLAALQNDESIDHLVAGFTDEEIEALTAPVELRQVQTKAPPKMGWVLVGLPLDRWGELSGMIEDAAKIDGIVMETQVAD